MAINAHWVFCFTESEVFIKHFKLCYLKRADIFLIFLKRCMNAKNMHFKRFKSSTEISKSKIFRKPEANA